MGIDSKIVWHFFSPFFITFYKKQACQWMAYDGTCTCPQMVVFI